MLAAKELGLETVPVDFQDYSSEADETADLLADNRVSELARLDETLLVGLLENLRQANFDLGLTGFDDAAFDLLIRGTAVPEYEPEYDEAVAGEVRTVVCPKCGSTFPV